MKLLFLLSALVFYVMADSRSSYRRPLYNLNYDPYDSLNWKWDESKKQWYREGEYEIPSENGLWKGRWKTTWEVWSTPETISDQNSMNDPNNYNSEHTTNEPKNSADFNDRFENPGSEVVMQSGPEQHPWNNPNHISEPTKEPTADDENWIAKRMEDWIEDMKAGEAEVDEKIGKFCDEFREGEVDIFLWIVKMKIKMYELIYLSNYMHERSIYGNNKRSAEYDDSEEDDEFLIDEFIEEFLRNLGEVLSEWSDNNDFDYKMSLDFDSIHNGDIKEFTKRSAQNYLVGDESDNDFKEQHDNMGNDYNGLRDLMNPDHTRTKRQFGIVMDKILRLCDKIKACLKARSFQFQFARRNKRDVFVVHNIVGQEQCIEAVKETLKQLRQPELPTPLIPPMPPSDEIM